MNINYIKGLFNKCSFFNKEIRKNGLLGCRKVVAERLFRAELAEAWDDGAEETVNWCSNNWNSGMGWGDPPANPYK